MMFGLWVCASVSGRETLALNNGTGSAFRNHLMLLGMMMWLLEQLLEEATQEQ